MSAHDPKRTSDKGWSGLSYQPSRTPIRSNSLHRIIPERELSGLQVPDQAFGCLQRG
jgi:hypothetical protein